VSGCEWLCIQICILLSVVTVPYPHIVVIESSTMPQDKISLPQHLETSSYFPEKFQNSWFLQTSGHPITNNAGNSNHVFIYFVPSAALRGHTLLLLIDDIMTTISKCLLSPATDIPTSRQSRSSRPKFRQRRRTDPELLSKALAPTPKQHTHSHTHTHMNCQIASEFCATKSCASDIKTSWLNCCNVAAAPSQ